MLVNTITTSMDPHTTFFPPVEKRYFNEQMSGRFFGIGASLRADDGNIKIATLVDRKPGLEIRADPGGRLGDESCTGPGRTSRPERL